jgi:hypothetical protein
MSINERPLPFPLKEGVAAAAAASAGRGRGRGDSGAAELQEPSQDLSAEQEDYYGEVERTRAPRDSDLSAVGAGRLSALNASSIAGKDADSFTMDEGTRFSHGSRWVPFLSCALISVLLFAVANPTAQLCCVRRARESYGLGGDDFGGFGGYDDYVPTFDAPLTFRDASPVEESKRGSGSLARARQPALTASNAISEVTAALLFPVVCRLSVNRSVRC